MACLRSHPDQVGIAGTQERRGRRYMAQCVGGGAGCSRLETCWLDGWRLTLDDAVGDPDGDPEANNRLPLGAQCVCDSLGCASSFRICIHACQALGNILYGA